VHSVAPGSTLFPGGSWDRRRKSDPEGIAAFVARELPLGRFGRPVEVAAGMVFLASQPASLVIGACLNLDGGQSRPLIWAPPATPSALRRRLRATALREPL